MEVVLSEYGPDLSRFPTEQQFVSHVTLAPHVPTSGGKPVRKKKRNSASTPVAAALRMAALSRRHRHTALGAYYRKLAQRRRDQHLGLSVPLGGTQEPFTRFGTGTRLELSSTRGRSCSNEASVTRKSFRRFFCARVISFNHYQEPMSAIDSIMSAPTPE